jgi:hypothetical protein
MPAMPVQNDHWQDQIDRLLPVASVTFGPPAR